MASILDTPEAVIEIEGKEVTPLKGMAAVLGVVEAYLKAPHGATCRVAYGGYSPDEEGLDNNPENLFCLSIGDIHGLFTPEQYVKLINKLIDYTEAHPASRLAGDVSRMVENLTTSLVKVREVRPGDFEGIELPG